jgi:hypothetical protein
MLVPDRLLFLHIPKTAGSTLHSIVSRQFKKKEQLLLHAFKDENGLDNLKPDALQSLRLLRGHFPFGYHTKMATGTFEYMTLLRDPVERVISHYKYMQRHPEGDLYQRWAKNRYSLEEMMKSKEFPMFNNGAVRMIAGAMRVPYGEIDEMHLQQALDNLEQYFPLVGVQSYFDEFILEIRERYGWQFVFYRRHRVATKSKNSITVERNEATLSAIREYNTMDQQLYEIIRREKEVQYASKGDSFKQQVKRFQKINRVLEQIVNRLPFVQPPAE